MTGKLVEDLFLETSGGSTTSTWYSTPVSLGGDNGVMVELWLTSAGANLNDVEVFAEGSNDGVNFEPTAIVSSGGATAAPAWEKSSGSGVIPWAWVRLRVELTSTMGGATTALVSAALRTYRAG